MKNMMLARRVGVSIFAMILVLVAFLVAGSAYAQTKATSDTNMQILRDKVKADKKLVVAAGMELTDAEGKVFWPVYDAYQKDLDVLNDRLKRTILSYADAYNNRTLTDQSAKKLSDDALAIEEDEAKMRKTYSTRLAAVLPGKKVARYMQIESKIRALLKYELAAEIPLAQ